MFSQNQRVVCVDDQFDPWVYDLFTALPKKDQVYTVRSVRIGRSNPDFQIDDDAKIVITSAEYDILLLLNELNNPDDPHSSIQQELGFRAERFAPLDEEVEEEEMVELIGVGEEAKNPFEKDPWEVPIEP
ncbi:MAG: hypothetical protein AAF236_01700 [Verrucomicrobiota bacterium]